MIMRKNKFVLLSLIALFGLVSCDIDTSSTTSTSTDSSSQTSVESSSFISSASEESSSSSVEEEEDKNWTDEEIELMTEIIGHPVPFFDFKEYGLSYSFRQATDYNGNPALVLEVEDADIEIRDAYIAAQVATDYEDQTSYYTGQISAGVSILYASYPDFWGIQQQVSLVSDSSIITEEGELGTLQAVFFQDTVPLTEWPADELAYYVQSLFSLAVEIPAPNSTLDEKTYYSLTYGYNYSVYRYFIILTATGDFTDYKNDLIDAGWTDIPDFDDGNGYSYLYSPDTSLGVYLYDYDESSDTTSLWFTTNRYLVDWPSETIDETLTTMTGNENHTPLPAVEASLYQFNLYSSGKSFYLYCYEYSDTEAYINLLLENEFERFVYPGASGYYDPLHEYIVEVGYSSNLECTIITVSLFDDDYLTEWPGDLLDSYIAMQTSDISGFEATIPDPGWFDYYYLSFYPYSETMFIDLEMYEYDDDFNVVDRSDDMYEFLEDYGWEEAPESIAEALKLDVPLYMDSATRQIVFYINFTSSFGTNMYIQRFDVDAYLAQYGSSSLTKQPIPVEL